MTITTAEAAKMFAFAALIMVLSISGRVFYYGLTAKKNRISDEFIAKIIIDTALLITMIIGAIIMASKS